MKLMEYNTGNIFLKKSYTNVVEKLVPDPFLKNQNWAYPWISSLKFYVLVEDYRNILKLRWWALALTSYKAF